LLLESPAARPPSAGKRQMTYIKRARLRLPICCIVQRAGAYVNSIFEIFMTGVAQARFFADLRFYTRRRSFSFSFFEIVCCISSFRSSVHRVYRFGI
jgi:hypothetical protein